jgi:hypothetical protein
MLAQQGIIEMLDEQVVDQLRHGPAAAAMTEIDVTGF